MNDEKGIRIVVQAVGVYSIAHAMYAFLETVAKVIAYWLFKDNPYYPPVASLKPIIVGGAIQSALLLIPAWVLLVKTDWCVQTVVSMSRPRSLEEPEDEDEEQSA